MCSNATRATDPRQMLNSVQGSRTVLFVCSVSLDVWRNASATWNTLHMVLACSVDLVRPVEVAFGGTVPIFRKCTCVEGCGTVRTCTCPCIPMPRIYCYLTSCQRACVKSEFQSVWCPSCSFESSAQFLPPLFSEHPTPLPWDEMSSAPLLLWWKCVWLYLWPHGRVGWCQCIMCMPMGTFLVDFLLGMPREVGARFGCIGCFACMCTPSCHPPLTTHVATYWGHVLH
jgi:hypothetical protein